MSLPANILRNQIRQFAADVVKRSIREWTQLKTGDNSARIQFYMVGVLDTAIQAGAITHDESQDAKLAVQGDEQVIKWW